MSLPDVDRKEPSFHIEDRTSPVEGKFIGVHGSGHHYYPSKVEKLGKSAIYVTSLGSDTCRIRARTSTTHQKFLKNKKERYLSKSDVRNVTL
jgi:hypothetical protein